MLFPSDPLDESQSLDQDVVSLSQMLDLLQSALADFQDHIYTAFINGQPLSDTIREIVLSLVNRSVTTSARLLSLSLQLCITCLCCSDDHSQFKGKLVAFLHNTTMLRESIVMMQTFLNVTGSLEQHQPHIIYAGKASLPQPLQLIPPSLQLIQSNIANINCASKQQGTPCGRGGGRVFCILRN